MLGFFGFFCKQLVDQFECETFTTNDFSFFYQET